MSRALGKCPVALMVNPALCITVTPLSLSTPTCVQVFTEGITNCLTGCYVGSLQEACVLVRVYGRNTELYVDRQREVEMFQLLHAHHCGPLIYCSFHNGICYEFVRGEVLDDRLLRQPSIFRLIAAEMGRIHSIKPPAPGPAEAVLWARMAKLLTLVGNNVQDGPDTHSPQNVPGLPSHKVLSDEMEMLKKHLSDTLSPVVLSHNDLLTKNIVYNLPEGTVKFIDYEYADYNYQAFDIGNHFNEFAGVSDMDFSRYPSRGLQREWLRAYLESYRRASGRPSPPTETEVTALYIQVCKFSLASNFFWGLWAMLQSHFSSIDFDFKRYATDRLHFYFQKKAAYFKLTEV
ncbi:unnamed protein product [Gadus morhua 'NCC']